MITRTAQLALIAGLVAIFFSNSLGGFCFRGGVVIPLVWIGLVDFDTAANFATMY